MAGRGGTWPPPPLRHELGPWPKGQRVRPFPDGYDDLAAGGEELDLDGLRVLVASIEDLIRMKRAAGRPKNLVEAEILGALRDEIDGG